MLVRGLCSRRDLTGSTFLLLDICRHRVAVIIDQHYKPWMLISIVVFRICKIRVALRRK
jgi:hypothetical protein